MIQENQGVIIQILIMRKLKLQIQMLDGFVATRPNDEQKWVTWDWDEIKAVELAKNCPILQHEGNSVEIRKVVN